MSDQPCAGLAVRREVTPLDGPAIHTPEAHDAITAELVACTLGQRTRLELRTDTAGRLAYSLQRMRTWLRELAGYRYPATR